MHKITRKEEITLEDLSRIIPDMQGKAEAKHYDIAGDGSFGAGVLEVKGYTTYPFDSDDYDEVLYVIEGTLTLVEDGEEMTLKKGDILWTPKGNHSQVVVKDYLKAFFVIRPCL